MSNLIIVPKKNGYLVRNQNDNREMAVFKTKQDAQTFVKNYKLSKTNVHSHDYNNHHGCNHHNNTNSNMMYPQQFAAPLYQNMTYPQMPGQMYPPNMMYPQQFAAPLYQNMTYPQMPGQMYPPNMMYPQQFAAQQPYNHNMMVTGYNMQNNLPNSSMVQQCECGYIYNNEYNDDYDPEIEENEVLDFETDSPELIKPPEISEMNKTLGEQKNEPENPKIDVPNETVQEEPQNDSIEPIKQLEPVELVEPVVEPIIDKEQTVVLTDLTNFSLEDQNDVKEHISHNVKEEIDTTNLSKKELKILKKQQKKELKLIKKQEKKNKHIYDEIEEYDF